MNRLFTKHIVIAFVVILVSLFVVGVFAQRVQRTNNAERIDASYNFPEKELKGVEILETLDMSSGEPRFKLHVQAHKPFSSQPDKLVLYDKRTKQRYAEYVLTNSAYPNECVSHFEMLDMMTKWDTDWFTVPEIGPVDNSYTSKLTNNYSVLVLYQDGTSQETNQSSHMIDGVCYQVQKTTPEKPVTESERED